MTDLVGDYVVKVFISHSRLDNWLVEPICEILRENGVNPYVAEIEAPEAKSLPVKFRDHIQTSNVIILLLTKNVMKHKTTRDIINWEVATAHALNKPIYAFREEGVDVPLMISQITDYFTYKRVKKKDITKVLNNIKKIAQDLKDNEDAINAIIILFAVGLGVILFSYLLSKAK